MAGYFRYYRVKATPPTGTSFPRPADNPPVAFLNYYEQRPVEGGAFSAWGELWYDRPLSQQMIDRYDLRPSPSNPDIRREPDKPRIAVQMAQADKLAQEHRATHNKGKAAPDRGGDR